MALRHSSITLTRDYYLDKKQRAVFAVSRLLDAPPLEPGTPPTPTAARLATARP